MHSGTENPSPGGHDFALLTPDRVLDALANVGLLGDGRMTALSSYENRVYQVMLEDGQQVVAKFYRPGRWSDAQIDEEHSLAAELVANDIPVVAPLVLDGRTLHHDADFAFSVSPRRGGRPPELDDTEVLEWIGRFLARLHIVGARQPFRHRPALTVETFALEPMQWLLQHQCVPLEVESAWVRRCEEAIAALREHPALVAAQAASSGIRQLRVHGDCHSGNILWTPLEVAAHRGPGPHFVDLDDARTGPAVQDLWMLVSGERAQQAAQLGALVDGYEQMREFDRAELALIEPLRTLRLIHYSAWLARRWGDPTFVQNFPWFGTPDYWNGQVQMLEEQLEAMQEPPLAV